MQLLVSVAGYSGGRIVVDAPSGVTADAASALVVRRLRSPGARIAGPAVRLTFTRGGVPLAPSAELFADSCGGPILLHASPGGALRGGKGGFGANLRAQGRASGAPRSSNFGACRDLSGRRLKSVNDEARLRAWLAPAAVAERAAAVAGGAEPREAAGPSGHAGWMLGVPSWAEGAAPKGDGVWRRPRKTVVCADWEAARAPGRRVPAGAPRSWGCPRGRACDFAHGVEELRAEGKVAALAAAREARERETAVAAEAATRGLYRYTNGGLRGPVAEGLRAAAVATAAAGAAAPPPAKKRARVEAGDAPVPDGDEVPWDGGAGDGLFRHSAQSRAPPPEPALPPPPALAPNAPDAPRPQGRAAVTGAAPPAESAAVWRPTDWCRVVGGAPDGATIEYRHTATTSERAEAAAPLDSRSSADDAGHSSAAFSRADVAGVAEFATVVVDVARALLGAGSTVYWEAEVSTAGGGAVQIGWAAAPWAPAPASDSDGVSGVGDDDASWAFDAARGLKWHGMGEGMSGKVVGASAGAGAADGDDDEEKLAPGSALYGRVVTEGDIVGVAATFHESSVSLLYSLNGESLGSAFEVPRAAVAHGLVAAVSLDSGEAVTMNLGAAGFAYAPSGAKSLWSCREESSATPPPQIPAAPHRRAEVAPLGGHSGEPQVDLSTLLSAAKASETAITVAHLRQAGVAADALGGALSERRVKAGGTWEERAARLVAVFGLEPDAIPKKLRSREN
jgi:hypothetical protein